MKPTILFLRRTFAALMIILAAAAASYAQGTLVRVECRTAVPCMEPIRNPRPLPNYLPVKSINLSTKIENQVATTRVTQIFRNDTDLTLEGMYFFPIPETASIVEFSIWENDKKLVGEVRSREEARRIYDEIVRRQRDPGLLEYAGKNLFQASIFPITPHSDKKLELVYTEVLTAENGTVSYRYPLGSGGRSRQNLPVFEDTRETRGRVAPQQKFGQFTGEIEIVGKNALRNIYSPTHSIEAKKKGENRARVTFESSNSDSIRDFQMFYGISDADFGLSLLTYREAAKDGYFLLQLSPKDKILETELVNKDVVFVLDTSGSMADSGKMEKARAALKFGVQTLREGDRFNVINFAGEEHLMEAKLISADASGKTRGEEFIRRLQPTGGTNINDALVAALKQFDSSSRPKMLVFMTDGLPTVGERSAEKIIANAQNIKVRGLRLFTFGVGYDVNTILLDKLASENGGSADYVEPKEDLEVMASNFFTKVNAPVLTDLEIDFGGVQAELIYPRRTPDIFRGTQLTLIGRYKNTSNLNGTTITLRGKTGGETRTFRYENQKFAERAEENSFLPRLWATRRVGWLTDQIRQNGEQKELRDEIVELGTKYGIVTPYTSYLAIENNRLQTSSSPVVRKDMSGSALNRSAINAESSGADAVRLSKNSRVQQEKVTISEAEDNDLDIKRVDPKTFYLREGVWTDSVFSKENNLTEVNLIFASDEFFRLIKEEPELAKFFSIGESVRVVWKNKVYFVTMTK